MKKIILSMLILLTGLMASELDNWFNKEYGYLKPYLISTDDSVRESYGDILYITVRNKRNIKIKTFIAMALRESKLSDFCLIEFETEMINKRPIYKINRRSYCSERLSFNGQKALIKSQMNQIIPIVSNVYNMTFNEETTERFLKK